MGLCQDKPAPQEPHRSSSTDDAGIRQAEAAPDAVTQPTDVDPIVSAPPRRTASSDQRDEDSAVAPARPFTADLPSPTAELPTEKEALELLRMKLMQVCARLFCPAREPAPCRRRRPTRRSSRAA
jgi:hypothetical protein